MASTSGWCVEHRVLVPPGEGGAVDSVTAGQCQTDTVAAWLTAP